jgi:hypothetical protein
MLTDAYNETKSFVPLYYSLVQYFASFGKGTGAWMVEIGKNEESEEERRRR